jgi:N-acetylglucosaminyldiphosphoundecaprenol N-acetyl-beta-D-mannosaminyltransferase
MRNLNSFLVPKWASIRILDVRIDLVDYSSAVTLVKHCISKRSMGNYICVAPVHPIMESQGDMELKEALENSILAVPDGMPVVWAIRLLGGSIRDRVYGPNLMLRTCEMAQREGYSIFLYGSKAETLEKLRKSLIGQFTDLKIAGSYSPPFRNLLPDEEAQITDEINLASPDILFVGLGVPRQEKWMLHFCPRIQVPVSLGVGAAFDFISREKKQAPPWMQKRGLEWLFRLAMEPSRLWARYLIHNPLFIYYFVRQLISFHTKRNGRSV